jgi:hypothetical protein
MLGQEKLTELSKSLPKQAEEALAEGNIQRLHYLLNEMMVGQKELDGLQLMIQAHTLTYMLKEKGEETLERFMKDTADELVKPYVKLYQKDEKQAFEEIMALYRNQTGAQLIPVKEVSDEIEYHLAPCGSGGSPAMAPVYQSGLGVDDNGVPLFCRACNKWQESFNEAVGEEVWTMTPNPTVPGACQMKLRKQANDSEQSGGQDIFSKEELWLNATPRSKQALIKVLSGDLDITSLLENQQQEWLPWHDYSVRWLAYNFNWLIREYGLDEYSDIMAQTYDKAFGVIYDAMDGLSDEERVAVMSKVWHYHIADFHVEEEEDRFAFVLNPCGSGGRLYRGEFHLDSFHYGDNLATIVEEEHPIAFNRKNAPSYCTHCASGNRSMFQGNPLVFVVDGKSQAKPGMACRQYVYKQDQPRHAHQELLDQVGMTELLPLIQLDQ